MRKHSILPGVAMGIIAGAAIGVAAAGMNGTNRRKIRRQAERAVKSVGDFARDLAGMIKD